MTLEEAVTILKEKNHDDSSTWWIDEDGEVICAGLPHISTFSQRYLTNFEAIAVAKEYQFNSISDLEEKLGLPFSSPSNPQQERKLPSDVY